MMYNRKTKKGRKGISPVFSAVILLVMTVAIASIVSVWLSGFSEEESEGLVNETDTKLQCVYSDIYIASASLDCNSTCEAGEHNISIRVRNSGDALLEVDRFSIVDSAGRFFEFMLNETKRISAGSFLNLTNSSYVNCSTFNSSAKLEKIIVSSKNCPEDAYDSLLGDGVNFIECS